MLIKVAPMIKGYLKRIVVRENGSVEIEESTNTIATSLKTKLNDALRGDVDYAADNLAGDPQQDSRDVNDSQHWSGKDFIMVGNGVGALQAASGSNNLGYAYGLGMSAATEPSASSSMFEGLIDGVAITIPNEDEVIFGNTLTYNNPGHSFASGYASPTTWSSITLTTGDSLTIQWTFTIS